MIAVNRRKFLGAGAGGMGLLGLAGAMPAWARGADILAGNARKGLDEISGPNIDLTVARSAFATGNRRGGAIAVNGTIPGPLLRLQEGTTVRLNVHNQLEEDTSIHWHGLLVPFQLDGVPGVSFPGVKPGETFTAEFPVRQSGTYWWHSHSGLQEQAGHYGAIVVDPAGPDPVQADREYIVVLSEFSEMSPHTIFDKLKKGEGYFNYNQNTWTDDYPLSGEDRRMWAKMRMMPTDILDVSSAAYTYLLNGHGPLDNLEYLFRPGERVRLRFINAGAMTFFNIRIPGLPMTIVQADGQNVEPVEVDEFQIGVAETYDVVVTPGAQQAYTLVAESMDRSGMGIATLASAPGARAAIPPLRDPPLLTMADMGMSGMDHGSSGDAGMSGMDHGSGGDMAGFVRPIRDGRHGRHVGDADARHVASAARCEGRARSRHGLDEPGRPHGRSRHRSRRCAASYARLSQAARSDSTPRGPHAVPANGNSSDRQYGALHVVVRRQEVLRRLRRADPFRL